MPILATLPILIILTLMVGFRWGAARAGAAGYLAGLDATLHGSGVQPGAAAVTFLAFDLA